MGNRLKMTEPMRSKQGEIIMGVHLYLTFIIRGI